MFERSFSLLVKPFKPEVYKRYVDDIYDKSNRYTFQEIIIAQIKN